MSTLCLTKENRETVIANLSGPDSEYKILLTSPEVLMSPSMQKLVKKLKIEGRLNFFAIDEARCIDTWGVDLRPEYQELGSLREYGVPIVALTGTATPLTIEQIKETLGLLNPELVKLPFTRENLVFEVLPKKPGFSAALNHVAGIINSRFSADCGIVYCSHREDTSRLSLELKMNDISSIHCGSRNQVKTHNLWLDGKVNVMCATNSFGMGIDKQDVGFVIHFTFPPSYEPYVQESGRVGRDGCHAHCIILYRFEDRKFHLHNIANATSPDARSKCLKSLNDFSRYLMDKQQCQQKIIAEHFESFFDEKCGNCSNCVNPVIPTVKDHTSHVKQLISCFQHMQVIKDKVSVDELGSAYIGSKAATVRNLKFDQVPEYGKGKGHFKSVGHLTSFINHLIVKGIFIENLREIHDKTKSAYLSVGNIREILNENVKELINRNWVCTFLV